MFKFFIPLFLLFISFQSQAAYRVLFEIIDGVKTPVSAVEVNQFAPTTGIALRVNEDFQEWLLEELPCELNLVNVQETWAGSEVRQLVAQGPDDNRITLTIVGDGYTASEKEKFFADAQRITDDLFGEKTFASYLALFNVYAVFVPSKHSGLSNRKGEKNTALGLYRWPSGSKRGILPSNKRSAEKALRLAPAMADYPILLANDEYYGGLGGRYAITTRSPTSGSMVLRHELGHNFSEVGEEYDGGQVYSGANFSRDSKKWKQWLDTEKTFKAEQLIGDYVWHDLNKKSYKKTFKVPKGGEHLEFLISSVGWDEPESVECYIDDQRVELAGVYTKDRSFFKLKTPAALKPGTHTVEFRAKKLAHENLLAYVRVFSIPSGFIKDRHHYAGYTTYNNLGRAVGYRPTYDTCLMRNMRSTDFCFVDQENMWLQFLARLSLVDDFIVDKSEDNASTVRVESFDHDDLRFYWYQKDHNGNYIELSDLRDVREVSLSNGEKYKVLIRFESDEVRKSSRHLELEHKFSI